MMALYARLVALFRLFQQATRRNLRSVPAIISFLRRTFHSLWKRKGILKRRDKAPDPLHLDPERDGGQPMVFSASQDPLPVMNALSQDYAMSNDFSLESVAHPSLNTTPEDVPAPGEGEGALAHDHNTGSASLNVEDSSTSVAPPLKSTTEGPPTMPEESTETSNRNSFSTGIPTLRIPTLRSVYPAFRPIVPTDIKRQNDRHGRAIYEAHKKITISSYLPGLIETQESARPYLQAGRGAPILKVQHILSLKSGWLEFGFILMQTSKFQKCYTLLPTLSSASKNLLTLIAFI
ncbi:hypothetical protein EYR40_004622 [Pleurotus pulmonarius]|nr:hypothetical protein EYR38_001858 [Pleurotus pulmonarius]KAF4605832.1 hypothetical protein EYR40_004622 [Pleurotus pulmonarius]